MTHRLFLCAALFLSVFSASAQLRYGFKTGLNFATINGQSELGANNTELETTDNITGFHIGMSVAYPITDAFSIRGEFLYSKRGMKYIFDGPGYRFFTSGNVNKYATGNVKYLINVSNSYIDIPLMAVGRWRDFEISGGGYLGFNIQSAGDGSLTFKNGLTDPGGNKIDDLEFNLSYNYRRDEPGEADKNSDLLTVRLDANTIEIPKTIGAYYNYPEDKGNLYKTLDYGLVGGISYYFSRALYLGVRLQYGLADITNNNADLQKSTTGDNNALIFRNDNDRNFAIQGSVGFSF
jgi:hypothetical protein